MFGNLFSTDGFMPHGHCYLWKPSLIMTHVISDSLIGLAYVSISIILFILIRKIKIQFNFVVLCFGLFIGACGLTHFLEVWNLWHFEYWISGGVKAITALASVGTGVYLYRLRNTIVNVALATKNAEESRLKLEERVQESEDLFRTMADSIPQLAWIADPNGLIFWYNKRWYEYTGSSLPKMKELSANNFLKKEEFSQFRESWKQFIAFGNSFQMEFQIKNAKGEFRWFLTLVEPVKNSSGEIIKWFGTNTDIDEQKRLNQRLQSSLAERDEFISIASHEMKTPLTSMKLQCDIASMAFKNNEFINLEPKRLEKMIEVNKRQIDRLTRLIDDMLDASRASIGKLHIQKESTDLNELFDVIIDRLSQQFERSGNIVNIHAEESIVGNWDKFRLEQVFVNILLNSIKYSAGTKIDVTLLKIKNNAEIHIQDYGMGISKEHQFIIFNRFERAVSAINISGLGLGLYISKEIISRHQGTIEVESDLGAGAKFIIQIPL